MVGLSNLYARSQILLAKKESAPNSIVSKRWHFLAGVVNTKFSSGKIAFQEFTLSMSAHLSRRTRGRNKNLQFLFSILSNLMVYSMGKSMLSTNSSNTHSFVLS